MSGVVAPPAIHLHRRSTREALALDPARELGAGGEARVLAVPGDDALVAKLYHEPTLAKARKVALMMADEPSLDASAAALAWPLDLLTAANGGFAGFLMERAAGPRVFELYNPSTRRHAAPRGDYALLHRVGANVAAAFDALHARGYVIGDVNESNVLVRAGGAVTLVDTDSMQVPDPANGTVLRSRVGKAEFTPPELQGRSFADFDRSPEHDRFGLAVLLFLLLMEGTHPFAGRLESGGEMPPIEERIRRGLFPHDDHAEIRPPRLAPDFSLLAPGVRALFVRCFEDGHADPAARPTAAEWRAAIVEAWAELVRCGKNGCHRYGAHLKSCPWCARAALLGGRDPFPAKAPPPPARRPAGSNRKGTAALRPAPSAAKKATPAPAPSPAKTAAPAPVAPAPVPSVLAGIPWLQGVPISPPLAPLFGPSGLGHPLAWVGPAALWIVLGPSMLQVLGVAAVAAVLWKLISRPFARVTSDTAGASTLVLLVFVMILAMARTIVPGVPFGPEPDGHLDRGSPDASGTAPPPAAAAPLVVVVGQPRTVERVYQPPRLTNMEEVESILADRSPSALLESAGVTMIVQVRPDGTVDPASVIAHNATNGGIVPAATEAARAMRFEPLTRGGTPREVWVEVDVSVTP